MATATATPELFTNLISTFVTDSDMGLGTVIGSLMFNILGVTSLSAILLCSVRNIILILIFYFLIIWVFFLL